MNLQIGSYVEIIEENSYKYTRGVVENIKNGIAKIKCALRNYPYFINKTENKIRIIV